MIYITDKCNSTGTKVDKREEFEVVDSGLHGWQDRYDYCQKPNDLPEINFGHIEIYHGCMLKEQKYCRLDLKGLAGG